MSVCGGLLTYHIIPRFREMFIKAHLYGIDLNKSSGVKVPEATGVITGCVFLMVCFVMIPFTYSSYLLDTDQAAVTATFPHSELVQVGDNLSPPGTVTLTPPMHRLRTARGPRAVSAGPPARCCSASSTSSCGRATCGTSTRRRPGSGAGRGPPPCTRTGWRPGSWPPVLRRRSLPTLRTKRRRHDQSSVLGAQIQQIKAENIHQKVIISMNPFQCNLKNQNHHVVL